ncbi:MAG: Cof-type HAD-IIB family hydrolase [Bacteroides sp.]|nr:Cof-type HAD-IIB family hydrolase [Bacteroides sp.]
MIRAIFFDIDGTLVPFGSHGIPSEVKEAIATVRSRGVKVFIATGRHLAWIDNLGDTEFDGYVTVNGGVCLLSDKTTCIYRRVIDREDIERVIPFSHVTSIPFVAIPSDGKIFINRIDEGVRHTMRLLRVSHIDVRELDSIGDRDVVQMMAFGTEEERRACGLFGEILRECDPTSWNPYFCDIIPKGSDKSVGIDRMIEHFGIDLSETMAFGDGNNDIGMLRHVAVGVAMGNADATVKEAANYITTADTEHGVVNAFSHFGLI